MLNTHTNNTMEFKTRYYIAGNEGIIKIIDSKFERIAGDEVNFEGQRYVILPFLSGMTMQFETKDSAAHCFYCFKNTIIDTFWEVMGGTFENEFTVFTK